MCFRSRSPEVCLGSTGTEGKMSAQTKRLKPRATNLFTDLKNSCCSSWAPLCILQRAVQKIKQHKFYRAVRSVKETDWTSPMSKPSIDIASWGVPGYALCKDHGKVVRGLLLFTQEASKLEPKGQIVSQKLSQHVFMFLQRYKVSSEKHKAATVAHGTGQKTSLYFTAWKERWENTSKLKPHMVHYKQHPPPRKKAHILERTHMCKPSHVEQTEAGSFGMSRNALSYGGGGAQTIPLVKQWLQNSRNVWNPEASHIFHLPKQIHSSLCAHMWKTGVVQQLLPESVNTLAFFQCAFLPFSCSAQLYLYYITFYSILSFKLFAKRRARWKNSSADQTLHVSQTSWLCTCRKMSWPGFKLNYDIFVQENMQPRKV